MFNPRCGVGGARGVQILRLVRGAAPGRRRAIPRCQDHEALSRDPDQRRWPTRLRPPGQQVSGGSRVLRTGGTITVPGDHARISIWHIDRPVAAISLTRSTPRSSAASWAIRSRRRGRARTRSRISRA